MPGKSLALGRDNAWGFLATAFLPVASSWAAKTGACGQATVAALPMCPPFPSSFHHAFSKPICSELCRTSLAFLLFSPTSPHLPDLYPSKNPLFPLQELLRKATVRRRLFYSSFSFLKCKLQKQERPREHVGVCVCLPGRGVPCARVADLMLV